jgi:anti-anti-sigma regulatory factor
MSKFHYSTREIAGVSVFDLKGEPTFESVQDVTWKIQKSIRRHRLQRIILNFQQAGTMDPIGLRRLLTVCLRPKHSVIFGASPEVVHCLEEGYLSSKVEICADEKEVAESFGPFLFDKDSEKKILAKGVLRPQDSIGRQFEKRRSHRMHVAIPLELKLATPQGDVIMSKAIATNISEGGIFAEYLDLEVAHKIDALDPIQDLQVEVHVFPSANFPEEYHLKGKIRRKEVRKEQLGLGIEFVGS